MVDILCWTSSFIKDAKVDVNEIIKDEINKNKTTTNEEVTLNIDSNRRHFFAF